MSNCPSSDSSPNVYKSGSNIGLIGASDTQINVHDVQITKTLNFRCVIIQVNVNLEVEDALSILRNFLM